MNHRAVLNVHARVQPQPTTAPMSSWQGTQRHSAVFVHGRMKPQPHGKAAYYVTLFVPTCNCSRIDLASYSIALLYAWANHIYARRPERALHPVGTQNAGRINYNHVTIAHTPLTTTCIAREWQGPSVAPTAGLMMWQCVSAPAAQGSVR